MSKAKGNKKDKDKKNEEVIISYSIIMIGDSAAGKTSLVERYLNDKFLENTLSTMGFEKYSKELTINNLQYRIDLFDTTGQERIFKI